MNLVIVSAFALLISSNVQQSASQAPAGPTLVFCAADIGYMIEIDSGHRLARLSRGEPDVPMPVPTKTVKFDTSAIVLKEITDFTSIGIPEKRIKISRIYSIDRVLGKLHVISSIVDASDHTISKKELSQLKNTTSDNLKRMNFGNEDELTKATWSALDPWKWVPLESAADHSADFNCERTAQKF